MDRIFGSSYYQDTNGYRGPNQLADFNKIQRTETTYIQGHPNAQYQAPGSVQKDSLKKSIFGNPEQELSVNLGRSKPVSRSLTPTHKLRGRDDPYSYGAGNPNINGNDPRISDAHMTSGPNFTFPQQQTTFGQDQYGGARLSDARTPLGPNINPINTNQGYLTQSQPMQTNQGQGQAYQGGQNYQYSQYNQQTYGQTQGFSQGRVFTTPTPLKSQDNPLQRTSTVVKVDPLTTTNISTKTPYFAEKRVLITGASSGIGRAVAMWYDICIIFPAKCISGSLILVQKSL